MRAHSGGGAHGMPAYPRIYIACRMASAAGSIVPGGGARAATARRRRHVAARAG
jgi:hypothetical protein